MKVENYCGLQNLQMRVHSPVKVIKYSVVQLAFLIAVISREVQEQWLVLLFIQGTGISNICDCFQVPFLSLYTNYYFLTDFLQERTLYCKPYAHWTLECVSQKTMDHSLQSGPRHSGRKHLLHVTGSNALVKLVMKTGQLMILWATMISGSGKPYT